MSAEEYAVDVVTTGLSGREPVVVILGEDGTFALALDRAQAEAVAARLTALSVTLGDPEE